MVIVEEIKLYINIDYWEQKIPRLTHYVKHQHYGKNLTEIMGQINHLRQLIKQIK